MKTAHFLDHPPVATVTSSAAALTWVARWAELLEPEEFATWLRDVQRYGDRVGRSLIDKPTSADVEFALSLLTEAD